jgi:hypothetical protein
LSVVLVGVGSILLLLAAPYYFWASYCGKRKPGPDGSLSHDDHESAAMLSDSLSRDGSSDAEEDASLSSDADSEVDN